MPDSDAFALKNSGLNEFLFAEVGTEANGSPLTILSVLACLGRDPWAEAAGWSKLPKASIVDCLADSISQMPLHPQALVEARVTAARLVLLLPTQAQSFQHSASTPTEKSRVPNWVPIAVLAVALGVGIAVKFSPSAVQPDAPAPLVDQVNKQAQPPTK
jgi:hypothetical protein